MHVLDSLACARVMLSPWRSYSCLFSLVLVLLLVLRLQLVLSLPPNCLQSIVDRHEAPTSRQPPARRRAPPSARARAAPRYGCIYGAGTAFQRMDASTRRSHALRSAAQSPWKREDYREVMLFNGGAPREEPRRFQSWAPPAERDFERVRCRARTHVSLHLSICICAH